MNVFRVFCKSAGKCAVLIITSERVFEFKVTTLFRRVTNDCRHDGRVNDIVKGRGRCSRAEQRSRTHHVGTDSRRVTGYGKTSSSKEWYLASLADDYMDMSLLSTTHLSCMDSYLTRHERWLDGHLRLRWAVLLAAGLVVELTRRGACSALASSHSLAPIITSCSTTVPTSSPTPASTACTPIAL